MKKIHIIKAKQDRTIREHPSSNEKLRVGVYVRVSTDSEEQLQSYKSQVDHYRDLVTNNSKWDLVDIYADEGISGTQTKNRAEFNRMIGDATNNKIDMIITKSISRFTRNVLDSLKYVRLLKEHNVAILFEKENINTMTMNGEMLLVILSSLAQQESESISANVKMGLKMKMKRGELVGFNGCLGYDYHPEDKSLTINQEEAEAIRYIFSRYIDGAGCYQIAREMTEKGIKTKRGNSNWGEGTVRGIIKNEKYRGDILLGKTFTVDPISHRRLANFGEEDMFYIENNHQPIVSNETFEAAKKIMNTRSSTSSQSPVKGKQRYSRQYPFSSRMKCGYCGGTIGRRSWHGNSKYHKTVWTCVTGVKKGKDKCPHSKSIQEKDIEAIFIKIFNDYVHNHSGIISDFIDVLEETMGVSESNKALEKFFERENKVIEKMGRLTQMSLDEIIEPVVYKEKYTQLKLELEELGREIQELKSNIDCEVDMKDRLSRMRKSLINHDAMDVFDSEVFESAIDHMVIGSMDEDIIKPYEITVHLKSGDNTRIDIMDRLN